MASGIKIEESEEVEYEVDETGAPKPPPSFNGALSKFAFASTFSESSTTSVATRTRSSLNRVAAAAPSTKRSRSPSISTTTITTSPPKNKKKRKTHAGYAPPSKYAHLSELQDVLVPNLICVFIGLNPGISTAQAGHAYAAPSNLFWKLLHSSGLTPDKRCPPSTDVLLPELYSLGNTNLVSRPTKDQAELFKAEMDESVYVLEEKIRIYRPESVCIVGKGIWESIWRAKHQGRNIKKTEFKWGWQEEEERFGAVEDFLGARAFVVPSTSGLVAGYSTKFKMEVWKELGDWVQERRVVKGETVPRKRVESGKVKIEEVA